ncbi:hypothetical protein [Phenylobacterium sp.]|uniref:hypothetical protein n=1 Tax=Phenylobacterium sp. TaxID=1871053 RepID=UPI002624A9D4|nr:hypothetical protein [Phenylobacterium sp.]
MTTDKTQEAVERLACITPCKTGYADAVMSVYGFLPEGQLYRDIAVALSELTRLQEEVKGLRDRERLFCDAVRWRQAQLERGILNMTEAELTEARAAHDKALATLQGQQS